MVWSRAYHEPPECIVHQSLVCDIVDDGTEGVDCWVPHEAEHGGVKKVATWDWEHKTRARWGGEERMLESGRHRTIYV